MGRFYNNSGMSVNILAATNTGNNRRTAVSMRRPVNTSTPKEHWNNIGETVFSTGSAPSKRVEQQAVYC
jgi:hypothetical protein